MSWFFGKRRAKEQANKEALSHAYHFGKEVGAEVGERVRAWLDSRPAEVSGKLLGGFRQRLATIHDSPPHSPAEVARVELSIFLDHVKENFQQRLVVEAEETLGEELKVAETIGARTELLKAINLRLSEAGTELVLKATLETGTAIEALGQADHGGTPPSM